MEFLLQVFIREIGFAQQPGIDNVLVEEFLADVLVAAHGDQFQLGKLVDLAFGHSRVCDKIIYVHHFLLMGKKSLDFL